jgi:hypothetical protein
LTRFIATSWSFRLVLDHPAGKQPILVVDLADHRRGNLAPELLGKFDSTQKPAHARESEWEESDLRENDSIEATTSRDHSSASTDRDSNPETAERLDKSISRHRPWIASAVEHAASRFFQRDLAGVQERDKQLEA